MCGLGALTYSPPINAHTQPSVAVIGCGQRGLRHVDTLRRFARGQVVRSLLVCDMNPEALSRAQAISGAKGTRDWERAVEDPAVDALVIATPAACHAPMVLAALDRGKHVFCEAPLALDVRTAATMAQAASMGSMVVGACGLEMFFHLQPLATLARQGVLGDLRWGHAYAQQDEFAKAADPQTARGQIVAATFKGLLPHMMILGGASPDRVSTLGMVSAGIPGLPDKFSAEISLASGLTLMLQCGGHLPTELFPVLRGTRASLELRSHRSLLHHNDGHIERLYLGSPALVPGADPTTHTLAAWLTLVDRPALREPCCKALFAAQLIACQTVESFQANALLI
ncbi:MAG: Gfo/Idh/MocA family oxidoreductase [Candidatus Hydrogenedentes bacterium]|nr:Gfo/Idh/MocA family oxidoreductase [Candidatus Hydrogenedentota bacterium]